MSERPYFTVVLPVCHGGDLLRRSLQTLRAMEYPSDRYEVLVAVGPDRTADERLVSQCRAPSGPRLELVRCEDPTRSAQLNVACARARGEVLAFADDDCFLPPDWLGAIERELGREPKADVVGGVDELRSTDSAFDLALDSVLNSFVGTGGARAAGGGVARCYPKLWNMAVRREAAVRAAVPAGGGPGRVFDERLPVHEDVDLCRRIEEQGGRVRVSPELRVGHRRETTFGSFLARNFRMARACRRMGTHRLPHVLLAGGGLTVAALLVLGLAVPSLWAAGPALMAAYAGLLLAAGVHAGLRRRDPRMVGLVPVLAAGLHAARAAGYLWPRRQGGARQ